LRFWPSSAGGYRGFTGSTEPADARGTFIVFHGNGGTAADRDFYAKALGGLGFRVILAEYPRYGGRGGELGEKSFVQDAVETVRIAFRMHGGPVYLLGESLGCGVVATTVASAPVPVAGVVLITPWDTLSSVAGDHFPFLPVRLFLKDSYDSVTNLSNFRGPIAVVGAERDGIIPIRHARDLYGTLSSPAKRMWAIPKAGHNDWPMHVDRSFWDEIVSHVSSTPIPGRDGPEKSGKSGAWLR
jgi:alpha-beta hydrolase superfamily lysophospholipase